MNLIFITEARFNKGVDNVIYSANGSYGVKLWNRYLSKFDRITVIARVKITKDNYPKEFIAESSKVNFIELPYFVGVIGLLKNLLRIVKVFYFTIRSNKDSSYILRVPGFLGSFASIILYYYKIPYAIEVVGDPWDVFSKGTINHPLRVVLRIFSTFSLKMVAKRTSAALYVTKSKLQKRYPVSTGVYTTNASNVDIKVTGKSTQINDLNSRINLIAIGSLSQMYKAPDIVLKAMQVLVHQHRLNIHLLWLGDGYYRSEMINVANDYNLGNNVNFIGNIESGEPVKQYLLSSDIFIHAARTEGLPRALIEAMSVGLPCIGTNVGGIPELLDSKAMVRSNNYVELVEKILLFINDKALRMNQSAFNKNKAMDFDAPKLTYIREQFYNEILNLSKQKH